MLRKLGINPDDLAERYPQLAAGGSGRQKHPPVPHWMLAGVELWARVVQQIYDGRDKPKMTRKNAIQWYAEGAYLREPQWAQKDPNKFATFAMAPRDAKAFASYLEKELRRNGFNKMSDKKLLLPGCKDLKQLAASTRLSTPPTKYFSV
jgi:hypothetical protein